MSSATSVSSAPTKIQEVPDRNTTKIQEVPDRNTENMKFLDIDSERETAEGDAQLTKAEENSGNPGNSGTPAADEEISKLTAEGPNEISGIPESEEILVGSCSISEMFDLIDKNSDDLLSHGELKKYLKKESWSRDWVREQDFHWRDLFSDYDSNKDGMIDRDEFKVLFEEKLMNLES